MPHQPTMTLVLEQCGSTHCPCVYNFLFMLTSSSLNILSPTVPFISITQSLFIHSLYNFCWILFFLALFFAFSYSVFLYSRWILILVLQTCLGLEAVFWNADLWRCHHCSMSWVSALAPQPHSPIHAAVMTCIIPHWLIWAASKLPSFGIPSQLYMRKRKLLGVFYAGVCKSRRHGICIFQPSPFSSLICIQWVRHVMVMQITCASCMDYFCPLTLSCSPFHRSVFTVAPHSFFSL